MLVLSCKNTYHGVTNRWNLSAIYNPGKNTLNPKYKIYHNSKSTSLLFFEINTKELLFRPIGKNGSFINDIEIEYSLFEISTKENRVSDSGTFNVRIVKDSGNVFYYSHFPIKTEMDKSYRLKILLRDKLRKTFSLSFLEVEKSTKYGQQFFNITSPSGEPLFSNILGENNIFKISHADPATEKLIVLFYKELKTLPKPTYYIGDDELVYNRPDSVFTINYSSRANYRFTYNGIYYITFDTNTSHGTSLIKFNDNFPRVTTPNEMIGPLSYIITDAEYKKLSKEPNIKLAIDDFWLKAGKSPGRGRELIRIYYNRVLVANYYFTNIKQGWKTDRGMVYIVYGPPHNLKKTANTETWYYYRKQGGEAISFNFEYDPNKFSLNHYSLKRSESYTWHWKEAVYAWTNGSIFLLD